VCNEISHSFQIGHHVIECEFKYDGLGAGTLAFNDADAHRYLGWGYTMLGIGSDQGLLARASDELVDRFRKVVAG